MRAIVPLPVVAPSVLHEDSTRFALDGEITADALLMVSTTRLASSSGQTASGFWYAFCPSESQDSEEVVTTSQIVKLEVSASIPIECEFWPEDDGWKGLSGSPSVMVRGSSFEDAKKNMATELQAQIEEILRDHPTKSVRRIA